MYEKFFPRSNITSCIIMKSTRTPLISLTLWWMSTANICLNAIPIGIIQKVAFIKGNKYRETIPNIVINFVLRRNILHPTPFDEIASSLLGQRRCELTPRMPFLENASAAIIQVTDQCSFWYRFCCKHTSAFAWTCITGSNRYNHGRYTMITVVRFVDFSVVAVRVFCSRRITFLMKFNWNKVYFFHVFFADHCPLLSKFLQLDI
mmetsp:Transcript_16505/g.29950  ORF Transcript_16505/g.29950 Transcript_16505/m.29950 type:complete len:205 (+) Transcript_16505:209-823(+)